MNKRELGQLIIKFEEWTHYSSETPTLMVSVYTAGGDYIGSLDSQICTLLSEYVIVPEKWKATHSVCSIGKSLKDGKWYGWSHRALFGFGIGDVVKEGDCTAMSGYTDEYLKENPEADKSLPVGFIAKTDEDARRMAIAFADSVS